MEINMKTRQLGKTKLRVSEIGFGSASIGNLYHECTDDAAQDVMNECWKLGIRYFDTAPEYGHGLAEMRMGNALRQRNPDEFILSTKVGDILYARHDSLPPTNKFINKLPLHLRFDYTYDGVMRAFEDSLQRLGLNRIDILLVHDLDPVIHHEKKFSYFFKTFVEEGYKALRMLRDEGVIQAIGLGVKKWEICAEVMKYGDYDCHMLQGNYTLLEQPAFDFFLNECVKKQISILLAGPYASGILATGAVKGAHFNHREANETILQRVRLIEKICAAHHVPMQAVAMQFPLMHAAVASVVVGTASAELMKKNVEFSQIQIPDSLWSDLKNEKIIPEHAPTVKL